MIQIESIGNIRKFLMARIFWGRRFYHTTAYWVDGTMVDTGCAHTVNELVQALGGIPVAQIVNTHSHEDHIAGNAALARLYNTPILAHPLAIPVLADPRRHQPLNIYRQVMWGYPEPSQVAPLGDTVKTEHHQFQVIHTPGHSADHVCLYEPSQGWLFTGDAYIGGRERALRIDYDIWGILASLKVIAKLEVDLLFPASGSVRQNPKTEINQKIAHLEELGETVLKRYHQGWSVRKISHQLFGRERLMAWITLGHFSAKALVRSFIRDDPSRRPAST
jgi:glyoxylase-like metal-dependent hydrolase (beta-lactamase superfamily II)